MKKNFIVVIALFCFLTTSFICASSIAAYHPSHLTQFTSSSPQAKPALKALNQLPEFQDLLVRVQREAPVHLRVQAFANFEGMWDASCRTISVNNRSHRSQGSIICTILFELHNAATTRYYDQLIAQARQGQLTKDEYVEKVEFAEYQNALKTSKLIEKGIEMGIFPTSARWPIPSEFDEHYKVQQICGHSLFIANCYNDINPNRRHDPYRGTIQRPAWMSSQDRNDLCRYVMMRSAADSSDEKVAQLAWQDLQQEVEYLTHCRQKQDCKQGGACHHRKAALLAIAFRGSSHFQHFSDQLTSAQLPC